MAIFLSQRAQQRVRHFIAQRPGALGLRFGVQKTGCSGWGYRIELAYEQREEDHVFDSEGIRIYVDRASLQVVTGTRIDFGKQGLGETFLFDNPNVTAQCGCGESFSTAPEHALKDTASLGQ